MGKTTAELCKIAMEGGSIKIDASKKTTAELCKIASSSLPGSVIFEL